METGKAVPFVMIDEKIQNGKAKYEFKMDPQARQIFQSERVRNKKLAIATIAGPQRTGKSFLSNRLLKRMKGFAVGPTTMPCTKGLWIWGEPRQINDETVLILVDTEGLNSVQRDINVDLKIFSLSILLSSVFIYNSIGHIDEQAIQNMSYVLKVTEGLRVTCDQTDEGEIAKYFPYFYWVLRDFSLDLKGQTQSEYLQNSLKAKSNDEKDPKNQIRKKIRKLFSQRRCQCFPRPVNEEERLAHIEDLNYQELRPVFKDKMAAFENAFYSNLPVKMINGKPLTGQIFICLVEEYLQALNTGKVPEIMTSLQRVVTSEARKLADQMLKIYKRAMASLTKEENMPMEQIEINNNHQKFLSQIKLRMDKKFKSWTDVGKTEQLRNQLFSQLEKQYKEVIGQNQKLSEIKCSKYMTRIAQISQPELEKAGQVTASLVTDKSKQFESAIKQYFQKSKGPRKYVLFAEKFPVEIFRYFSTMIDRIRRVYTEQATLIRKEANVARAEADSVRRIMKEQENSILALEKQIKAKQYEVGKCRKEIEKTQELKIYIEEIEQMNNSQVKKQLTEQRRKNDQLQKESDRLRMIIDNMQEELNEKRTEMTNVIRQRSSEVVSTQDSEMLNLPNDVVSNILRLREKLTSINDYFTKKIGEDSIDEAVLSEIQKIRRDKHTSIERMKEDLRLKKQQARKQIQKIKESYEKNVEMMNKHIDAIKSENIELERKLQEYPGNEDRIRKLQNQNKKFEQSLKIKQSNLMLMSILNMQKDKDLEKLKNTLNNTEGQLAVRNAEKANFEAFKETYLFVLMESLKWTQKKPSKLKHSLKSLNEDDRGSIIKVFEDLNLKPF